MLADAVSGAPIISGIFITHAHRGHYTGLLELGLETMDTNGVPVYVMARMRKFLEKNEPFATIARSGNIELRELDESVPVSIESGLSVTPFAVSHRNELSETVGFLLSSDDKELIYLPDIDSWEGFESDIKSMISSSSVALIDGTFYSGSELGHRDMSRVPHPPISSSMRMLSDIDRSDRGKVYFTHLNHTNPAMDPASSEARAVTDGGFNIAADRQGFAL